MKKWWIWILLIIPMIAVGCINITRYSKEITTATPATININNKDTLFPIEVLVNGKRVATIKPGEKLVITTRKEMK
ncbi:MAG: hypothetical protein HYW34_03945 [Candidatus Brennerbacteria bacterium]|nr:hypothetical protein [Candidatus Brennerbacteria bacterium]